VLLRELATRRDAARLRRGRPRNEPAAALLVAVGPGAVLSRLPIAYRPARVCRAVTPYQGRGVLVVPRSRDACIVSLCLARECREPARGVLRHVCALLGAGRRGPRCR